METAGIDIDKARDFLREKENRARKRQSDEFEKIVGTLKNLEDIWQKYKINKVYLYGSVTRGRIHDQSDVDIAVEGDLEYQQLLHLFAEVDKHLDREIDLRNLDEIPFKDSIIQKGVVIYEK